MKNHFATYHLQIITHLRSSNYNNCMLDNCVKETCSIIAGTLPNTNAQRNIFNPLCNQQDSFKQCWHLYRNFVTHFEKIWVFTLCARKITLKQHFSEEYVVISCDNHATSSNNVKHLVCGLFLFLPRFCACVGLKQVLLQAVERIVQEC